MKTNALIPDSTGAARPFARDIPILMYHDLVAPGAVPGPHALGLRQFESQLDALQRAGWVTRRFPELRAALEGCAAWPARGVWITFDDGYASFLELAVPALRARGMTATVFAVAGEIGGCNRWDASRGGPHRTLLDEHGLRAAQAAGMEIGSHGWAHRNLTTCSAEELEDEIVRSRGELQDRLGVAVSAFAYPYGHYAPALFPRLVRAGYHTAVAVRSREPCVTSNLLAMRRAAIHAGDSPLRFRLKLSRLYFRYRGWRRS